MATIKTSTQLVEHLQSVPVQARILVALYNENGFAWAFEGVGGMYQCRGRIPPRTPLLVTPGGNDPQTPPVFVRKVFFVPLLIFCEKRFLRA